jgi:hypothetical protein
MTMKTAVNLGLCGIGVIGILLSVSMENPLQQPIGPGYVPLCVSMVLTALGVIESVRGLKGLKAHDSAPAVAPEAGITKSSVKPFRQTFGWLLAALLIGGSLLIWSLGGFFLGMTACIIAVTSVDNV